MPERSGRPRKPGSERYQIRAVERALSVLDAFTPAGNELSLKQIAANTGLSKPTAFRILSTLERHNYITFDSASVSYRLGSKLLELGGLALSSLALRQVAGPYLNRLQAQTASTVLMAILMDDALVYIDKRETAGPLRIASDIGWRRSPHFGMLGQVLMAFQTEAESRRLLDSSPLVRHTPFSILDEEAFVTRLADIRRDGYVVEFDEAIEGVWGVAAPVRGFDGKVIAAVGVASPVSERSQAKIAAVATAVDACARGISEAMGYNAQARKSTSASPRPAGARGVLRA
jgi:DNA-binding IclR family transcriptional regulator